MATSTTNSIVAAFCVALMAGCGPSPEPWGGVSGVVTYRGKAAHPVIVLFDARERGIEMTTTTDEKGEFTMTFGKTPGLPAGVYKIAIRPARFDQPADGMTFPKNRVSATPFEVPERYRNPETSGLVATVAEGVPNHFQFELRD